jgi:hypothetical protein
MHQRPRASHRSLFVDKPMAAVKLFARPDASKMKKKSQKTAE